MGRSFRIGAIHGIDVKVHPTFAIVVLWFAYQWGIAAGEGVTGVVFGTLALLTIFGCILVHELAHALVAIQHGLRARDIIILPFGGVARIENATVSSRSESIIALAGPAMNFLIALILTPFAVILLTMQNVDDAIGVLVYATEISIGGFLTYIWVTNLIIAVFNLIPAFPMDGGRILRAGLTHILGKTRSTQIAAIIGYAFAVALAVFGIMIGDYMLPILSVFIIAVAQMEASMVRMESALQRIPVGQFALYEGGGIRPDAPIAHAINGGPRDITVTRDGVVVGMLWRHELLRHLNGAHHDLFVRDIMDRRFNAVDVTDSIFDVYLWLEVSDHPAVPVVENGIYRGIFTAERLVHVHDHINRKNYRWLKNLLGAIQRAKLAWR